jgi:uncharacterized phosphosugar-binding protein
MSEIKEYIESGRNICDRIAQQENQILQAAEMFAKSILAGRMVHVFGSGHSRIMVEEMWPRYGSFPGFNPIVELSLTFHNLVVGSNGQRQAMYLENVSGLAEKILRNFVLSEEDTALIISSGGTNIVPIEMAEVFKKNKVKVVSIISVEHSNASKSKRSDGVKIGDVSDLILDTGSPIGDSMIKIEGLATPVAPGSSLGGILLINCIKAKLASILTKAGQPPTVLTASNVVGDQEATRLFEKAYDEHAIRMAKLYQFKQS